MRARRSIPPSTRLLVLLHELWIPAVWAAFWLAWAGSGYAESGCITAGRETVDLPAHVVYQYPVFESRGKNMRPWSGYRVRAEFEHDGVWHIATGIIGVVPPDGEVSARVPVHRPDLAVAFVGTQPHYRFAWIAQLSMVALGFLGLGLLVRQNSRVVHRLTHGRLVRARCARVHAYKRYIVVRVTYDGPSGPLQADKTLIIKEAERVLADPDPFVVWTDDAPRDPFALAQVVGLRCSPDGAAVLPASWIRAVVAGWVLVVLAAGLVYGLVVSRLLPPA